MNENNLINFLDICNKFSEFFSKNVKYIYLSKNPIEKNLLNKYNIININNKFSQGNLINNFIQFLYYNNIFLFSNKENYECFMLPLDNIIC